MNTIHKRTIASTVVTCLTLAGCTVVPTALTPEETEQRASQDLTSLFVTGEPVTGPITLAEAMARALKYNLDYRVQIMEEAVAQGQIKVARMELLPQMTVAAGYTTRSNYNGASSQSLITGEQSLESSTSQERSRDLADARLVWNLLDFGVSYVKAKQDADRSLIAAERRRKVIQNVMQDVRYAFWRAWSAQELLDEMNRLIEDTRSALARSRALEREAIRPPRESLLYQRDLLDIQSTFWELRQQLSLAKTELATLMNLGPGTDFTLAAPAVEVLEIPELDLAIGELEHLALVQRPELREQDYTVRISSEEVRKAMLRMLPGLELDLSANYDSNKFLWRNQWAQAGLRVTWNLFNVFRGFPAKARAETQVDLDEIQRLALSMAVLTQVHLAHQRYLVARESYAIAVELSDVNQRILVQVQAARAAKTAGELELIRTRARALIGRMRRDLAYSELQNARGRIDHSTGRDPLPETVAAHDIPTLSEAIAKHLALEGPESAESPETQEEPVLSVVTEASPEISLTEPDTDGETPAQDVHSTADRQRLLATRNAANEPAGGSSVELRQERGNNKGDL